MNLPAKFMAILATACAATGSPGIWAAESAVFAQDLLEVTASDKVLATLWTRRPESYTLQVVLDRSRYVVSAALPAAQPVASQTGDGLERSSFFIGNTIANLRCLDPDFGGRTLTLIDGRRSVSGSTAVPAAPAQVSKPPPVAQVSKSPRPPQVQVWLLRADGTLLLPARESPKPATPAGCPTRINADEILFRIGIADGMQAVAAAIAIDDEYYIEKLQSLVPEPAQ
jgi:hypothetical protein